MSTSNSNVQTQQTANNPPSNPQAPETKLGSRPGSVDPTPASYHKVSPLYSGNPLIEALPAMPGMVDLIKRLQCLPPYQKPEEMEKADRESPRYRKEMLEALKFFFQPLPRHFNLAESIFSMIRVGYGGRCPRWGQPSMPDANCPLESAALLGSSGCGKTQSIRRVLGLIAQVIIHTWYNERKLNETQVTWLRVECPHDASPRGLCSSFFEKVDEILGTDHSEEYGGTRSTANVMIPGVATLVRKYHLGLLVIDEIQNLFRRKTKASQELEDFIVRIVNDLQVPVLMIGTSEMTAALSGMSPRIKRRVTGLQQPTWTRLAVRDVEWMMFTDALSTFRYVLKEINWKEGLSNTLFDLTQGIPDLVVKLFYLAQCYAINEGIEEITSDVLRKVMEISLLQNKDYLQDIRDGKPPRSDYVYENVYSKEGNTAPETQSQQPAPAKKKRKKRVRKQSSEPDSQSSSTLPGLEMGEGGSSYEAAKKAGLVHETKAAA